MITTLNHSDNGAKPKSLVVRKACGIAGAYRVACAWYPNILLAIFISNSFRVAI